MTEIELSKAKAKIIKSLSSKKDREKTGLFVAEGAKCVEDMLSDFELAYLVATKDYIEANPGLYNKYCSKFLLATRQNMAMASSFASVPEVLAVFKIPEKSVNCKNLENSELYLFLDSIQDPGNLGTIIRTCDWFGVYDIYASPTTVDVYNPKVVQATMGSLSRVKVHYTDLSALILKNRHLKVIGTLLEGTPLSECKLPKGGILIMGNEGNGISDNLKRLIDIKVTIPPVNPHCHPDSLNVSIATAICLNILRSSHVGKAKQ